MSGSDLSQLRRKFSESFRVNSLVVAESGLERVRRATNTVSEERGGTIVAVFYFMFCWDIFVIEGGVVLTRRHAVQRVESNKVKSTLRLPSPTVLNYTPISLLGITANKNSTLGNRGKYNFIFDSDRTPR